MFFLFLCGSRTVGGGRREKMAKFLNYEDRLEIQNGLKEHLTFTEIGKRLGRDRTTITKEAGNYSVEQDTGYSVFPHNTCKYRKGCRRKKVCGTSECKHPLVPACRQCELLCNRYCEQYEERSMHPPFQAALCVQQMPGSKEMHPDKDRL